MAVVAPLVPATVSTLGPAASHKSLSTSPAPAALEHRRASSPGNLRGSASLLMALVTLSSTMALGSPVAVLNDVTSVWACFLLACLISAYASLFGRRAGAIDPQEG